MVIHVMHRLIAVGGLPIIMYEVDHSLIPILNMLLWSCLSLSLCRRSASNYILGLTPLPLPAFMGGTVIGMGVWSVVYSSIGGAGRSLLQSGVRLDELLAGARRIVLVRPRHVQLRGHG